MSVGTPDGRNAVTLYYDATIDPGGVVRSMRQHDSNALGVEALAAMRPIVRSDRWAGPLEVELGVDLRLPWADWTRHGPDAALTLTTSAGVPLTYSGMISGRGVAGLGLIHGLATMEPVEPGATVLTGVPLRPLLATRVLPSAVTDTLLLETCGEIETLIAAAFFDLLKVSAPETERWDH